MKGGPRNVHSWVSDDYLTPPALVEAIGPFDVDVCASVGQPWETAKVMWTVREDGLSRAWPAGKLLYANPPYRCPDSREGIELWMSRLADHGNGVALVFARTDARWFQRSVWNRADALFFFANRIFFHLPVTGERARHNGGAPSVLVLHGKEAVARAARLAKPGSPYPGRLVRLRTKGRA